MAPNAEQQFRCQVDANGKATELPLCRVGGSTARNPHMRAFWGATISFFLAFVGWFAFTPLELEVAASLGLCENIQYPVEQNPRRKAYLKFKNLKTMQSYCQYGRDDKTNPTDCLAVPAAIEAAPLCSSNTSTFCVTAEQKLKYRPKVLAACVCTPGTECAAHLGDASTASVASTIATRVVLGALLERLGPVNVQCLLLIFGSIWVAAGALVSSVWSYIMIRFFVGMVGATFVTTQFWNSLMFAPGVVGTANGVSAGWGNLGGGVTQLLMPFAFFEPLKAAGLLPNLAWRVAMLFPAFLLLGSALLLKLLCWDTPVGRRFRPSDLGKAKPVGFREYAALLGDLRVVIMVFHYAACFGTELAMYNQLPRHFSTYFQMRSTDAAAMASIFGLTNIFSRPLGGVVSDLLFAKFGFRARLWLQFAVLTLEAVFLFAFGCVSNDMPVEGAAVLLFLFSIFCEMGCGTTYAIVPLMNRQQMATISALVGAGGNLGAVIANVAFYKPIQDELLPYKLHAAFVLFWACLTPLLYWPEHGGMFRAARFDHPAKHVNSHEGSQEVLGKADTCEESTQPETEVPEAVLGSPRESAGCDVPSFASANDEGPEATEVCQRGTLAL